MAARESAAVRPGRAGLLVSTAVSVTLPAAAARLDIPRGPLAAAIVAIGNQAGVTIGLNDPALGRLPLPPLHGRFSVAAALDRLLRGSDATFVAFDDRTFQIVRHPMRNAVPPDAPDPAAEPARDIVVTGSKRATPLDDYPGSAIVVDAARISPARVARGSEVLIEQLPILASTHLGPGRDKLFIRGLADSSFAGPTQATVGQYLGEVRLNYNAPDPDLALYDIRAVEVLEGPQGTLYGAGSLGGIIRLEPEPPDPHKASGELAAGATLTRSGDPGQDASAIVNLPVIADRLALRVVAYESVDGGYIDDAARGLSNINRTVTSGGRATLRLLPAEGWTIDLGGVVQDINSRDGQYAERRLPPLTRESAIAQPFDNDYGLGSLVLRHVAGAASLVSATSFVSHDVSTAYNASTPATVRRYTSDDKISLLTNETRLSHTGSNGGSWVLGAELLHSADSLSRTLGPLGIPRVISGTRNTVDQASLFGELTLPLSKRLSLTGGGRLSYAHQTSDRSDASGPGEEPHRDNISFLPSVGALWKVGDTLSVYARYQEGYRPGGLSVQSTTTQRFDADSVGTWEAGLRYGDAGSPLSLAAGLSYARWENIQADLVDADGLPFTDNVGSGRVVGLELRSSWRPMRGLTADAAFFANSSRLNKPAAGYAGEDDPSLPNIPAFVGRGGLSYARLVRGHRLSARASIGFIGRSRLGVGPLLSLHQGNYWDTSAGLSFDLGRSTISLDATNLTDRHGNVFALGNPFGVTMGSQSTPLRPTTLRLGVGMRF